MARLVHLALRDVRNIARATLDIPEAGLALIGDNGHGKTNLLEAIYYLQLFRSMRGARDQDVVRFEAAAFHIAAHIVTNAPHDVSVGFERAGKRKRITIDGAPVTRLSEALGALPAVIVSPRDVELIAGGPAERRHFLDVVLALTSRRYLHALQQYRAALTRRNSALREATRHRRDVNTIAVWEPALAEHGAVVLAERAAWVAQYAERFAQRCAAIGEREPVQMRYTSNVATPENAREALLEALAQHRAHDMQRGATRVGPHRDDVAFTLGARDLRVFGSAGQQRTAAIALRMLEAETLRTHAGAPLLLLDDPFAELDVQRSAHILGLLRETGMGQTILVVPRASDIPPELTTLARWHIAHGVITATPS